MIKGNKIMMDLKLDIIPIRLSFLYLKIFYNNIKFLI